MMVAGHVNLAGHVENGRQLKTWEIAKRYLCQKMANISFIQYGEVILCVYIMRSGDSYMGIWTRSCHLIRAWCIFLHS